MDYPQQGKLVKNQKGGNNLVDATVSLTGNLGLVRTTSMQAIQTFLVYFERT
jgi:hypothetical protein